eukprot:CAMPEP_0194231754 /NCGR_PEP_ID=MMETSP0158-20130606/377_1 /TAXON_ID=33649 /ORGANISM="Thalassionema nitzschioides, Strain L26-B" /LENGTH=89 /DNA_ID=CAMNT_0038964423 /DNA_START=16 /DNA_END=282 /DNA_ORIENTATION=+
MTSLLSRNTAHLIAKHAAVGRKTITAHRPCSSLGEKWQGNAEEEDIIYYATDASKAGKEEHIKENIMPVMKELKILIESNDNLSEDNLQ